MKNILFLSILIFYSLSLGAQNIPRANFTAPWGVQVNTFTGNLYLQRADLILPNQGLSLEFTFAYNAFRDTLDQGYGQGWTSTFGLRYEMVGADSIRVERMDGRRDLFVQDDGVYRSPAGIFDTWEEYTAGQFRLTTKYGMRYIFADPAHRSMTRVEDPNGNALSFQYAGDTPVLATDQSGRSVALSWTDGQLVTLQDDNFPGGRTVRYAYANEQLVAVTDPEGAVMSYVYDAEGQLTGITNENGDELQIRYNSEGRVAEVVTCAAFITFTYNADLYTTYVREQDASGDRTTTYTYDETGKLQEKTGSCCGYNTQYRYDESNNVNQLLDANGNTFSANHDERGNTLLTTDASGAGQAFAFDPNLNRLQSLRDKNGNTTEFTYDDQGNLIRIDQPEGIQAHFGYDAAGNVTSMQDGNGNLNTMTYNSNNDLTALQLPIGSESYTYDGVGNLLSSTDGNGNSINYNYDKLNRLRTLSDDLSNEVQYEYDGASNLILEIDANDYEKHYTYDVHHRLESVTTPAGLTFYSYDSADNLTDITDDNDHTTQFQYDERNLLVAESDPLGHATTYSYDGNGNVLTRTDANGQTTSYTYDQLNRLLSKSYDGNTDSYTYDANGNLLTCSNNDISMSFSYDGLNRLSTKTIHNWGVTITYTYDGVGNRIGMTDPTGTTSYTYDGNNRLTSITNPAGETTQFTYDVGGRLTRQDHANGTYVEYTYDVADRLLLLEHRNAAGTVLAGYGYTYDGNGNRLSMTTLEGVVYYTYDGDNRLLSATYEGFSQTDENFTYDGVGNRVTYNGTSYEYDAADRLQAVGTIIYDFDSNGNLTLKREGDEITRYSYDLENRLVRVQLPDGTTIDYRYDPFGNRISQQSEGNTTRYLLDGDNVLLELDLNGNTLARYTAGLELDSWISMERDGASYFYHTDGLGSTRALTSADQTVVAEYHYDAYGNMVANEGDVVNPYTYTGREYDEATDLYYYRTRFYDAGVGRFLTKDGFPGFQFIPKTLNRYSYVGSNPINYNDPDGMFWNFVVQGVIGVVRAAPGIVKGAIGLAGQAGRAIAIRAKYIYSEGKKVAKAVKATYQKLSKTQKANLAKNAAINSGKFIAGGVLTEVAIGGLKKGCVTTGDIAAGFLGPLSGKTVVGRATQVGLKFANLPTSATSKAFGKYIGRGAVRDIFDTKLFDVYTSLEDECFDPEDYGTQDSEQPGDDSDQPGDGGDSEDGDGDGDCDICIPIVRAIDPNEIIAPEGCGLENWVAQQTALPYTILYENDPDFATAPAQLVRVEHTFAEPINPFSFRLGDFGFGSYYFSVPDDVSYYNTQIDLSDSLGVLLDVTAGLNATDNTVFWVFQSRDPATGLTTTLPADVGYLPVNDTLSRAGEGFVNFTVEASPLSVTADTILAQASIIFDDNAAILTNVEFNLVDADHPISQLTDVVQAGDEYTISWMGTDVGAGIGSYVLYASANGGPYVPVVDNLTATSYVFTGNPGSSYDFFTIAIDCVGNPEPLKADGCALVLSDTTLVQPTNDNADGSILLEIGGGVGELTYSWSPDILADSLATGLTMGLYQVTITDELGCTLSLTVELDGVVGTTPPPAAFPELFLSRLFPVPAREEITVEYYSPGSTIWLEVFDVKGERMFGRTLGTNAHQLNQTRIPLRGWPAGSYLVRLRTRDQTVSGVFVKQ